MAKSISQAEVVTRLGGVCLAAALVIQIAVLATGDVARTVERAWVVRGAPALERSAQIAFGGDFSDFLSFIRSTVPDSAKLVVPPKALDPVYGDIGLMQYFLRPRTVVDCPVGEDMVPCVRSLTGESTYILAVPAFPPQEDAGLHREFVGYSNDRGVYVPRGASSLRSGIAQDEQATAQQASAGTLVLDLMVLALIVSIGSLLLRLALAAPDFALITAASVPVGVASLTFSLFLISWLGVSLDLWSVILTGSLLALVAAGVSWTRHRAQARPSRASAAVPSPYQIARPTAMGASVCITVVGIALLISVARSYSTWDDMAAYAVQGYGIAREGSVAATRTWGPSAADYPPNIPLAISVFHLLDGDALPGSKLLFPLYLGTILLAAYRVWRRAGHTDAWAAGLALSVGTIPLVFDHSTTGYTNLPFSAYLVLGCALTLEGCTDRGWRKQLLGGILLAGAIWTRPEALLVVWGLLPVLLIAAARLMRGQVRLPAILLPPALVSLAWIVYGIRTGTGGQMSAASKAMVSSLARGDFHLDAPYWTLRYLGRSLIDPSVWGLVLPLGIVLLVVGISFRRSLHQSLPASLLAASAAVGAATFLFYYLVSFMGDLRFWLGTGVERMFLPAVLLGWLGLGALAAPQRIQTTPGELSPHRI